MPSTTGSLPPLNTLRIFDVAARAQNFRQAAEELGVTHAAVAQQMRSLEGSLGVRLFERLPRGIRLTDAGQRYATSIRRALDLIVEATAQIRPEHSRLTISVTPSFASRWLVPRLSRFIDAHPDIDLRVQATDRLSNFQVDGVDIAVRYGQAFSPTLNSELLLRHRIIAVASAALFDERMAPVRPDDLADYPWLHDAHNYWPQFIALGSPASRSSVRNIHFNHTTLALDAAAAGQGIALASHYFVEEDIAAGRLIRVLDLELPVDAALHMVWPRRTQASTSLAEVRRWLVEQVALADERILKLMKMQP